MSKQFEFREAQKDFVSRISLFANILNLRNYIIIDQKLIDG